MTILRHTALAALLVAASGFASAAGIVSTVGFSNIKLGVLDLTPADGKAAHYEVTDYYTNINYQFNQYSSTTPVQEEYRRYVGLQPASLTGTTGQSTVALTTDGTFGNSRLDSKYMTDLAHDGVSNASLWLSTYVTISAHSVLTVSGTAFSSFDWQDPAHVDGYGYTYFGASFWYPSGADTNNLVERRAGGYWAETDQWSENFWLAYANTTDSDIEVSLSFDLRSEGRIYNDTAPPVPEPATYAMLGAGLLLTGAVARRRARRT